MAAAPGSDPDADPNLKPDPGPDPDPNPDPNPIPSQWDKISCVADSRFPQDLLHRQGFVRYRELPLPQYQSITDTTKRICGA